MTEERQPGDGADDESGARAFPGRVGPYRLVREIGRGGMGRVFLAEQETPDFRRTVALKLVEHPAPDSDAIRRFRDEVRILASLEHPWIARFLDGGRSPEGVWFLALEYVEGDDLVTHARKNELDVAARVRLVASVAEAAAYAHERGVVHRDLKPGNVLVGRDGRPRLLDFGISKLLDPDSPAGLTTTGHGPRPLTPAYASPEQLDGHAATPASDVYSLGIVLYELLTGRRPGTESAGVAGSGEPEPPSTAARRAASSGKRSGSPATTSGRGAVRRISRDLDAICLQAIRHDPGERYANAAGLAADLRRYLDGEPVEARHHGRRSRWTRLVGRPGPRWAIAAALLVAAIALGVFGLRSAVVAPRPPGQPAAPPGVFPLDPINPPPVEEGERRLAEAPTDLVAGSALAIRLARERRIDEAGAVVARLRQVPGAELDPLVDYTAALLASSAGETQRAHVFLVRARDNALAQGRAELLGTIRLTLGSTLDRLGHREAAHAELVEARALLARAADHRPLYRALVALAALHYERGEIDRCGAMYEEALRTARSGGFEPLVALTGLAEVDFLRGRPDLAEPLARGPLAELRQHPNPARPADALTRLALIVRDLGRSGEAETLLDEAIALLDGAEHPAALADVLLARSQIDLDNGRLDRIDAIVGELERLAVADVSRRPLAMARSVAARKAALADDLEAAREAFAEARRLFLSDGYRDYAALSDLALAEAEARAGRPGTAVEVLDTALAGFDEASAILPRFFAALLLARIDAAAGRPADARRRLAELGQGLERSPSLSRRIAYLAARGAVAASEGRHADARRDLSAALAVAAADGRTVAELELRLDLATLGDGSPDREALEQVRLEAEALGLRAIAGRARQLADTASANPGGA